VVQSPVSRITVPETSNTQVVAASARATHSSIAITRNVTRTRERMRG
jgi:hypothetical protein